MRNPLEYLPELVVDEREGKRDPGPVQELDTVAQWLDSRAPEHVGHLDVALDPEVTEEVNEAVEPICGLFDCPLDMQRGT